MSRIFLILIFIRPFISSLAYPYLNSVYSASLIGCLVIFFLNKRNALKNIQVLNYPVMLFLSALIISIVSSPDRIKSLNEFYNYVSGLLMLLFVSSLSYEDRTRVLRTVLLSAFVISLLAIYQYLFGFQHLLNYIAKAKVNDVFALEYIQRKRVFFPFITPNTLAGYLIMIIPLALINKNRIWFILPLSFALLLTKSLGAFFSIFLALTIYFCLNGGLKKRVVFFLSAILLIIVLVFIARSASQKEHLHPLFSTMTRLNYWKQTLEIFKRNPISGVGIGNFDLMQSRFAHNSYLQIGAEMGAFGIIGFIWIIFVSFKIGLHKRKAQIDKMYISGLLAANAAFLIHNFVDFSFFLAEVSLVWWLILGLIAAKDSG